MKKKSYYVVFQHKKDGIVNMGSRTIEIESNFRLIKISELVQFLKKDEGIEDNPIITFLMKVKPE